MPVLYTHLIPATFGGRARMNVANALAAAAAAWAAGRPPARHPPGPADVLDVVLPGAGPAQPASTSAGVRVVIDYCHNVDGMRQLADFVERMMVEPQTKAGRIGPASNGHARTGRAIGVIGIPGDRRDEDQREYGAIAARRFDEIIVREDKNLRGRAAGRDGGERRRGRARGAGRRAARAIKAEKVLDEMAAVRAALRRATPGDLVVCCVDDAVGVYREAMAASRVARAAATAFADPGELEAPEG